MAYPFTKRLSAALSCCAGKPNDEIPLKMLQERVGIEFGDSSDCAKALMQNGTGSGLQVLRYGELVLHLIKVVECDSAVRDVLTVGHLGKLLSRLQLINKAECYKALGVPNILFDQKSQQERLDFFKENACLSLPISVLRQVEVVNLQEKEDKILSDFGLGNCSQ